MTDLIYVFTARVEGIRAYQAFQRAAGLPRKRTDWVQFGGGRHAVMRDTFDPDAKSNPGWDSDETGPLMKHPTKEEYSLDANPSAKTREGERVTVDGRSVKLPTARVARTADWDDAVKVREKGKL